MLKDAVRRKFDILMVWSIDRLGRSVLHVANALAGLDAAGIRLYCDQQGIDSSTPMGRAMIQMASVFGEQERSMLRAKSPPDWSVSARRARSSHRRDEQPIVRRGDPSKIIHQEFARPASIAAS